MDHPKHRSDEKEAWDRYSSSALNALISINGGSSLVREDLVEDAAKVADALLEERRKRFRSV